MALERQESHPQTIAFNDFLITLDGSGDTLRIEARHNNEVVIFEYSPEHIVFDRQFVPEDPLPGRPTRITGMTRKPQSNYAQEAFEIEDTPEDDMVSLQGIIHEPPLFTRAKRGQNAPASFIVAQDDTLHEITVPARLTQATKNLKLAKGDRVEVSGHQNTYTLQLQNGEEREYTRVSLASMQVTGRKR